jgi:signal transduction histidine kinase
MDWAKTPGIVISLPQSIRRRLPGTDGELALLDTSEQSEFEELLQRFRSAFLFTPILLLFAFGPSALLSGIIATVAIGCSYGFVWLLRRRSRGALARYQLSIRLFDCALIYIILCSIHIYLGQPYYEAAYLFPVMAAAITHGTIGALVLAAIAGTAILLGRIQLIALGILAVETRHITDAMFYALLSGAIGLGIAFLVHKGAGYRYSRDQTWRLGENMALDAVIHDLRNSLSNIRLCTQLMTRRADADRDSMLNSKQVLTTIEDQAESMRRILDQTLEASRLTHEQQLPVQPEQINLGRLVRAIVGRYSVLSASHEFKLQAGSDVIGSWDTCRLERAIDNLINNAVKYSPYGGTIELEVRREVASADSWAVVVVRDHGIGIPQSDLPMLFTRCYRAANAADIPGTGLGLAGVREAIESLGGTITVNSQEGLGTTLTVRLPLN